MSTTQSLPFQGFRVFWIIFVSAVTLTFWSDSVASVYGAPVKLDFNQTPFTLELRPPFVADAAATLGDNVNADNDAFSKNPSAIDSYGNPIEKLIPIQTLDGRKVVSTHGFQFEIPTYASGITEIMMPADDLLPPFFDPIAVALPNVSAEVKPTSSGLNASDEISSVDIESVKLSELKPGSQPQYERNSDLPQYILDLHDPDIGGPVEYMPIINGAALNVLAWDLLPPRNSEPTTYDSSKDVKNASFSITEDQADLIGLKTQLTIQPTGASSDTRFGFQQTDKSDELIENSANLSTKSKNQQNYRGSAYYSSTTPTSTTNESKRVLTTITTMRTTSQNFAPKPTHRASKATTTTPETPLSTTDTLSPTEFYKLEPGDSNTLPSWLSSIDDDDLDVAVTFVVPSDLNEYNHTIDRDLLPPLEPFVDLNIIQLPSPEDSTTESTLSTRHTTTTRMPQHPTTTTTRSHWIRAQHTTTQNTNTYNNRFTSNHIASSDFTNPQLSMHTVKLSTDITTSTAQIPETIFFQQQNPFNKNGHITATDTVSKAVLVLGGQTIANPEPHTNPFLPALNRGAYDAEPKSISKNTDLSTIRNTNTTTTTTTAPKSSEENPFDSATLPTWLSDFDYPNIGPGIPFMYNHSDSKSPVSNDLLPPLIPDPLATEISKSMFITPSPSSFIMFNQHTQNLAHQAISTTPATFSFPSKVMLPLPSIESNQNENAISRPPIIFMPPPAAENQYKDDANEAKDNAIANSTTNKTSFSSNKNFSAPFEPTTASGPTKTPASTNQEMFPPFSDSNTPPKITFTKSDDGKVITNNVFLQGTGTQSASKPFGFETFNTQQRDFQAIHTNQFFSTSAATFTTSSSSEMNNVPNSSVHQSTVTTRSGSSKGSTTVSAGVGGKYTGGFGGAQGVLGHGKVGYAVQRDGSIRDPDHTYRQPTRNTDALLVPTPSKPPKAVSPEITGFGNYASAADTYSGSDTHKYLGDFGGPPGVLCPYDNVKGTK